MKSNAKIGFRRNDSLSVVEDPVQRLLNAAESADIDSQYMTDAFDKTKESKSHMQYSEIEPWNTESSPKPRLRIEFAGKPLTQFTNTQYSRI